MFALVGAHRVGKSTLAKEFAERTGMIYCPSHTSEVIKAMELDINAPMTFDTRMTFQEKVLDKYVKDFSSADGTAITDRSPLDFATYAMIEAHKIGSSDDKRVLDFQKRCFDATNGLNYAIVCVQPGIPFVKEENKSARSDLYQELYNMVLIGMLQSSELKSAAFILRRGCNDLEDRIVSLSKVVEHCCGPYMMQMIGESTLH